MPRRSTRRLVREAVGVAGRQDKLKRGRDKIEKDTLNKEVLLLVVLVVSLLVVPTS